MRPNVKFPRAPIDSVGVVPSPELDSARTDELERLSRLTVLPPLYMSNGPDGQSIRIVLPALQNKRLHLTSAISGQAGRYNCKIVLKGINESSTGDLTAADLGTDSTTENAIFWNLAEAGLSIGGGAIDLTDDSQSYITVSPWPDGFDTSANVPIWVGRIEPAEACS